jgi:hypothetical protein
MEMVNANMILENVFVMNFILEVLVDVSEHNFYLAQAKT